MTRAASPLSPEAWPDNLSRAFQHLPQEAPWTVALSGGLDSVVLLHLARAWRQSQGVGGPLRAVHVNHGLADQADAWAEHCTTLCQTLGVELAVVSVAVPRQAGTGLEDAARSARYQVFARHPGPDDALLLAHHADDQAETQLYRMMRGAGLAGYAGMPESRALGSGRLYRPLLSMTRHALRSMAEQAGLDWVEDPSNRDDRHDRNFLRNQVMPLLKARWPGAAQRMSQNARHAREAMALLDERALEDARTALAENTGDLLLEPVQALSGPRRRNLIQWWLRHQGLTPLGEKYLAGPLDDLLGAGQDRNPEIRWAGQVMQRYNGRLVVLDEATLAATPEPATWRLPEPLHWAGGRLEAWPASGEGLSRRCRQVRVCRREGGERLELPGGQHQPLKKWLQSQRLAPWERDKLPLLWSDGILVGVAGYWLHPRFKAQAGEPAWAIGWRPPEYRAAIRKPLAAYSD